MRTLYPAFCTHGEPSELVGGRFSLPDGEGRRPAVVICHGSDGVDGRGQYHADALHACGVATLELDMWSARGTVRGHMARPREVAESLPAAFGALAFLASQPEIDAHRIGILGFSWGGMVSMLSAVARNADRFAHGSDRFVAHSAFYPVLWSFNQKAGHELNGITGAPLLIQAGAADAYDSPSACESFLDRLDEEVRAKVRLIVHPGATHAFDRDMPEKVVNDPLAHDGRGGEVHFRYHPVASFAARAAVADFFVAAFDATIATAG
jgi:uncharacterized protein